MADDLGRVTLRQGDVVVLGMTRGEPRVPAAFTRGAEA